MPTPYEPAGLPAPQTPASAQPGGYGPFVRLERCWGQLRRTLLRSLFPGHVRRWQAKMHGRCPTHGDAVIDPRDLKYIRPSCGISFDPADDVYAWRERAGFARYGYAELVGFGMPLAGLAVLGAFLAAWHHPWWMVLFVAASVFLCEVVWFFRDPRRSVPGDPSLVISPADGTITHAAVVDAADFPDGRALRVSIFLSVFSVHGNRAPYTGTVERVRYYPGEYLDARHAECSQRNEQLWLDGRDPTGRPWRVIQISGAIARRIVCWARAGDTLATGQRYGMIKFGSRTELFVAADAELLVKIGDGVVGGVTPLARWRASS